MKTKLLLLFATTLAACGGTVELAEVEDAIINGQNQSPTAFAAARVETPNGNVCTMTLVANNLGVTSFNCIQGGNIVLTSASTKVQVQRAFPNNVGNLVIFQLRDGLPVNVSAGLKTSGFFRDLDTTPLAVGEQLDCFGYEGQRLRSGVFNVVAKDDPKLQGVPMVGVQNTPVTREDLGGFCTREGHQAIAAFIFGATDANNRAWVQNASELGSFAGLHLMAQSGGVALGFERNGEFLSPTGAPPRNLIVVRRTAPSQADSFQAIELTQGQYKMVNALNGNCLGNTHPLSLQACSNVPHQNWQLRDHPVEGVVFVNNGETFAVNDVTKEVSTVPFVNEASSQNWRLWLTRF